MTVEGFRELQRSRPFQPFAIHLADGRFLSIRHPEIAALSRTGRTVRVANDENLIEVLDLLLVVSLRPFHAENLSR